MSFLVALFLSLLPLPTWANRNRHVPVGHQFRQSRDEPFECVYLAAFEPKPLDVAFCFESRREALPRLQRGGPFVHERRPLAMPLV